MERGFLWYLLTGDRPSPSLEGWAWFLRDHPASLAEALGPNFEKTMAAFEERRRESREIAERYGVSPPGSSSSASSRAFLFGPDGLGRCRNHDYLGDG
jgi:hypothetical protein